MDHPINYLFEDSNGTKWFGGIAPGDDTAGTDAGAALVRTDIKTRYSDDDGDGYSDGVTTQSCTDPGATRYLASELIATSGDCDDTDSVLHPGTVRYKDAEGDGYSDGTTQTQCADP